MITLENNKLAKVIATAETVDGFIKKNIKLFLVVVVIAIAIAVSMFLTTGDIVKYLTPLYSETTLWVIGGSLGILILTKSMWLLELFLKISRDVFKWMFFFPLGISIVNGLVYSDMTIFSTMEFLYTTEIGIFILGAILFVLVIGNINVMDEDNPLFEEGESYDILREMEEYHFNMDTINGYS